MDNTIFHVATVLTVYGIETGIYFLPFIMRSGIVATVLTVYGIETSCAALCFLKDLIVATVLTVYGIETIKNRISSFLTRHIVATVLTVYGIETTKCKETNTICPWLQQYLPFTVLKPL